MSRFTPKNQRTLVQHLLSRREVVLTSACAAAFLFTTAWGGVATGLLVAAAIALLIAIAQLWSGLHLLAGPRPALPDHLPVTADDQVKANVVQVFNDLNSDFALGKLAQSAYDELRDELRENAALALDSGLPKGMFEKAEALVQQCQMIQAIPVRPVCDKCETSNDLDAKFCKSCGHAIESVRKASDR